MAFGYSSTAKFEIYVYREHCVQNAMVLTRELAESKGLINEDEDGEVSISFDISKWGEGTEDELVAQAREAIASLKSSGPSHVWRCAKNVLDYFNAPLVEETEEVEEE